MTIGGVLEAMGTRDLRANLRAVVEKVEAGSPVVCLKDGQPLAVMISHEEAERWRKIEDSLAALHALGVYPEALADPSELADLASLKPPDRATIRKLTSEPRAILSPLRTIGVSDARAAFATLVARWPKAGSERSSPEVIWLSPSSRHRNTTVSAPWRDRSAGSAAPGWTSPPPRSSRSSTSSVPTAPGPAPRGNGRRGEQDPGGTDRGLIER